MCLRDACRNCAHADLGHQFDVHPGTRIGVLEVMNELLEVLDRVDVMVRRWRNEADAGRRVTGLANPRIDLWAGQLATLARLRPLRHFDLEIIGIGQVFAGHTKSSRGDLFDRGTTFGVVQSIGVFAALAGIGLRPQPG